MIIGIGIPSSQSRMGMDVPPFSPSSWNETRLVPRAIAVLATFSGSETGSEGAKQKSRCHPKRELRNVTARLIGGDLGLLDNIIDALFRIGLAEAGLGRNQAGDISPVCGREPVIRRLKGCRQKARYLSANLRIRSLGRGSRRRRGTWGGAAVRPRSTGPAGGGRRFAPKQPIHIDLRGIGIRCGLAA